MRALRSLTGRTVVIATPATTVRGVVAAASASFLTVRDAQSLDRPEPVAIVGSILVPVSQISYVQVVA